MNLMAELPFWTPRQPQDSNSELRMGEQKTIGRWDIDEIVGLP